MTVDQSFQFLVIILSATLAVALVLAIVALIKTIQILKVVKQIVQKADDIADKAENVAEFISQSTGPLAIARAIGNIADAFKRNKRK
jgi:type IV secretory pathway component VirB8